MFASLLRYPTDEDWIAVKTRCLVTIGKTSKTPPDDEWKVRMLRCRHSPIRYLQFSFLLSDIPYWLSTELCRHHVGIEKYVRSQRDDRTVSDIPRSEKPQGALVDMIVDINADALITLMNKRLCGCATEEMQELMIIIRNLIMKSNPEFTEFLVPMCVQMRGCNEFTPCGKKALYFRECTNE